MIRAAEDVVWGEQEDAYAATRALMHWFILPFKVYTAWHWANARFDEHVRIIKKLRHILFSITFEHAEGAESVARLARLIINYKMSLFLHTSVPVRRCIKRIGGQNEMTNPLIDKAEEVIWGEVEDAYSAVSALVIREMRWRIWPGVVWETEAWARSKAKEHCELAAYYKGVADTVKKYNDDHSEVEKLSTHHGNISRRYKQAALACRD